MATVRQATVSDADAIGHAHVDAWRAAYGDVLDADFLAGLDPEDRARGWRRHLAGGADDPELLVIVEGGAVQGFVLFGAPDDDGDVGDLVPLVGQVHALNLRPQAWGRRLGDQLLAAAEARLARRGARRAVLWVVAGNARARRLYERRGWAADGRTRRQTIGPTAVEEVRYVLELAGEDAGDVTPR